MKIDLDNSSDGARRHSRGKVLPDSLLLPASTTGKLTESINYRNKTNGSLSREKRPSCDNSGRPKSPSEQRQQHQHRASDDGRNSPRPRSPPTYENIGPLPSPPEDQQVATPNNNRAPNWPEQLQHNGYATLRQEPQPSSHSSNYEEIGPENYRENGQMSGDEPADTTNGERARPRYIPTRFPGNDLSQRNR